MRGGSFLRSVRGDLRIVRAEQCVEIFYQETAVNFPAHEPYIISISLKV